MVWKPAEEDRAWQYNAHQPPTLATQAGILEPSSHVLMRIHNKRSDHQYPLPVFHNSLTALRGKRRENLLVFGVQCTGQSLDSESEETSIKTETSVPIIHSKMISGTISLTLQCMKRVQPLTLTICRQLSACSLRISSNGKRRKAPKAETHPRTRKILHTIPKWGKVPTKVPSPPIFGFNLNMEKVENQMVAKIFLLLPFFFSLHVVLWEASTSKLDFCQKLQLQLLCCLCKHCLVLVCLMGEAQPCQSRMSLDFKHSRILLRSRMGKGL